jgi:glucokinase
MSEQNLVIGDIGGTNARFALANQHYPGFHDVVELKCADFASALDALRYFLGRLDIESLDAICLAAAGPLVDHSIDVTNNHWSLSAATLASEFDVDAVRLLNDFEAIAYSIPFLAAEQRLVVGGPRGTDLADRQFNVAILGPGTGLGVAGLSARSGAYLPVTGEGGHVSFAPESDLQLELLRVLRSRFGRVSAERLVAGPGIENIFSALLEIRGENGDALTAADIFAAAGVPGAAADAVTLFFEILGQVAGDLALTLGAYDGVYIAGGIAKRYPEMLAASRFRAGFESKGRYSHILEKVPTYLILHEQPGLLGVSYLARKTACGTR